MRNGKTITGLAAAVAIAALSVAAMGQGPARAPEPIPRDVVPVASLLAHAPLATITGGDVKVVVALPDAIRGFYRSTRFDWSGMVIEVTRGGSRFYGPWVDGVAANVHDFVDRSNGVVSGIPNAATGPAEEFANRDGETVPGYDAASAGGTFIKIGVGRLRKPDLAPYDHFRVYPIVDGGRWIVERSPHRIVFRQRVAPDAGGYGYEYEKTLSLSATGTMTLAHRLTNIGRRPIHTQLYTHNFARFDGAEIGRGVAVTFPFVPVGEISNPNLANVDGRTVHYVRSLAAGDRVSLPPQVGDPTGPIGPIRVTGANGAEIAMVADVPLVRTVLWSMRRTVAVEPFVAVDVSPGATQRWSWNYTFTASTR